MSYGSKKHELLKAKIRKELETNPTSSNKLSKRKIKKPKKKSKGKRCH